MQITEKSTVGGIVSENYRTAEVFKKFKIDFLCSGSRSILEMCKGDALLCAELITELATVLQGNKTAIVNYNLMPLDLLVDYIKKSHHKYIEEQVPLIKEYLDEICNVHGVMHPQLFEVNVLFYRAADELIEHIKKEELILFPYILKIINASKANIQLDKPPFQSIVNPIAMMLHEHIEEVGYFKRINSLTNEYTASNDGCNSYKLCMALLKKFEENLYMYIHVENNILFPRSINKENAI